MCFRFNQILCQRSFAHLRAVFDEYAKISSKTVEDAIKSEFSGDIKTGLQTVGERLILRFQFSLLCFALQCAVYSISNIFVHIILQRLLL